jgi:HEAT repeat protein
MDAPPLAADLGAPDHEDYVINRQGELAQLGMSDDPADLKTITSELNNKDPRIRSSALSAAVQFGSQDAIPALQNEMQWTDDPQEKVDLMNAIKYLQLPSFQASQATDQTPPTN